MCVCVGRGLDAIVDERTLTLQLWHRNTSSEGCELGARHEEKDPCRTRRQQATESRITVEVVSMVLDRGNRWEPLVVCGPICEISSEMSASN